MPTNSGAAGAEISATCPAEMKIINKGENNMLTFNKVVKRSNMKFPSASDTGQNEIRNQANEWTVVCRKRRSKKLTAVMRSYKNVTTIKVNPKKAFLDASRLQPGSLDKAMDSSMWPDGVYVTQFFLRREQPQEKENRENN